jgi:hypothetical protein
VNELHETVFITIKRSEDDQAELRQKQIWEHAKPNRQSGWLTLNKVKKRLGQATGLTPERLRSVLNMKQQDDSLEEVLKHS